MTCTGVGARERHTWGQAQSMRPAALPSLRSPSVPAAQAFQEGLVVQEHPEDPEGEKKSSDPEESSAPSLGAAVLGRASLGALADETRHRGDKRHTCGPGCQELPIQSPGAPCVRVGVAREGERLQATPTPSAGLRGEAAGQGAGARASWARGRKPGLSPRLGERLLAPLTGMPEKMGSPREGQEHSPGSP